MRAAIEELEAAVELLSSVDPHTLPDVTLLEWSERILRVQRRLDGITTSHLQVIDNRHATTTETGRSTRAWLVEEQHVAPREADARMRVARASLTRPAIVESMTAGDASLRHGELIVNFLPKLDPDIRDLAEHELLKASREVDPATLNRGLRELQDRLCLDESAEERAVRRYEGRWFRWNDTFNGMTRFECMLPPAEAAIVKTALTPLSATAGEVDERHVGQRRADAFVELARIAMNSGQLPETAGEPTQIAVSTDYADLTRQLLPGETCHATVNGTPITPNTVRMLACDAGIIPAVMNGLSDVLDLGRSSRTWTRAQRKAAKLRAGGCCEAPGCQTPIDRCHLHHEDYWAHGGRTDLANAIYLCSYHHWLEHHTSWHFARNGDGTVEVRRT